MAKIENETILSSLQMAMLQTSVIMSQKYSAAFTSITGTFDESLSKVLLQLINMPNKILAYHSPLHCP